MRRWLAWHWSCLGIGGLTSVKRRRGEGELVVVELMMSRTHAHARCVYRKQPAARRETSFYVRASDLLVCNYQSYIDLVYLLWTFDPVFTQATEQPGVVRVLSFWQALAQCGQEPNIDGTAGNVMALADVCKAAVDQPVAVFPEVSRTSMFPFTRALITLMRSYLLRAPPQMVVHCCRFYQQCVV